MAPWLTRLSQAEQTDPMHRLALVTAYEALEMSGYAPNRTPSTTLERVGTYYGQASDDWRELNAAQNIGTHAVPGGERAFANGRINYFFKFGGPSFNIDTAMPHARRFGLAKRTLLSRAASASSQTPTTTPC